MKQKDKFLLLMVLSCLPLGNAVAEQTGAGLYSPINQEVLQNTVKITGQVIDPNGCYSNGERNYQRYCN